MTGEYVARTPGSQEPIRGPEGSKAYRRTFRTAFPDLSVTIEDRIVGEDAGVDRYRIDGTHEGEFMGVPPTGLDVAVDGTVIHYLERGTVVEDVSEFDALDLLQQLGVVGPPVP